jgi:N-acetylmuramoyl-L-alanine amidase
MKICISSGHGKYIRGASGYLDEVDCARAVVEEVAKCYRAAGVEVETFHDNTSTTQNANLNAIVNWHNARKRDYDISCHFNAYKTTQSPMGCEVLYYSQQSLADKTSKAICSAGGFINRGPKKRTDLFFLKNCRMPAILLEVCFVDSSRDAELYRSNFVAICRAIAEVTGGVPIPAPKPPEPEPPEPEPGPIPPAEQVVSISITAPPGVIVSVTQAVTGVPGLDVLVPAEVGAV